MLQLLWRWCCWCWWWWWCCCCCLLRCLLCCYNCCLYCCCCCCCCCCMYCYFGVRSSLASVGHRHAASETCQTSANWCCRCAVCGQCPDQRCTADLVEASFVIRQHGEDPLRPRFCCLVCQASVVVFTVLLCSQQVLQQSHVTSAVCTLPLSSPVATNQAWSASSGQTGDEASKHHCVRKD